MSTMIERVARAMASAGNLSDASWEMYLKEARAAITAIEETHVIIAKDEYERINN
jgi:hypothetical protein